MHDSQGQQRLRGSHMQVHGLATSLPRTPCNLFLCTPCFIPCSCAHPAYFPVPVHTLLPPAPVHTLLLASPHRTHCLLPEISAKVQYASQILVECLRHLPS